MEVERYLTKGGVYFLHDMVSKRSIEKMQKHLYLVLATRDIPVTGNRLGYVQCMCITSMRKTEPEWEVPIITDDGTIGYIVPYNLFSVDTIEFNSYSFRGYIGNSKWGTTEEFFELLMDLYCMIRQIGHVNKKKVQKRFKEYTEWFYEEYSDAKFHRDVSPQRFNKEDIYSKPSINAETMKRVSDQIAYMHDEDDIDTDKEPEIKNGSKVSVYRKQRSTDSIEDLIKEDEEIAADIQKVEEEAKEELSEEDRLYRETVDEYFSENKGSLLDLYDQQIDDNPEIVYSSEEDADAPANLINIPSDIIEKIPEELSEEDKIAMRKRDAMKKLNEHSKRFGERISLWQDETLGEYITLIDILGANTIAERLHCTASNVYSKRKAVKKEIVDRELQAH